MNLRNAALPMVLVGFACFQALLLSFMDVPDYDEAIHLDVARNLRELGVPLRSLAPAGSIYLDHTPLYLYLLAAWETVVGNHVFWLRTLSVIAGAGSVVFAFRIGSRVSGPAGGGIAAALVALNPYFLTYSVSLRPAVPFCFFLLLAIDALSVLNAASPRRRDLAAAGWAIAATVMMKETGLVFLLAAVVGALLQRRGYRERLVAAFHLGLPTLLSLGVWLAYAWRLDTDRLTKALVRFALSRPGGHVVTDPRYSVPPAEWLERVASTVIGWPTLTVLGGTLLLLAVEPRARRRLESATWVVVGYLGLIAFGWLFLKIKEPRHVIGLVPALAVTIASIVDWTALRARVPTSRWGLAAVTSLAAAAALVVSPINPRPSTLADPRLWLSRTYRIGPDEYRLRALRAIGVSLEHSTHPDAIIVSAVNGPTVSYYARRRYRILYTESFETSRELVKDADIVVWDPGRFQIQTDAERRALLEFVEQRMALETDIPNLAISVYRRPPTSDGGDTWGQSEFQTTGLRLQALRPRQPRGSLAAIRSLPKEGLPWTSWNSGRSGS